MAKKCEVILNNSAVTVVKYAEDHFIQFPAINKSAAYVLVKKENGNYFIVDENEVANKDAQSEK